MSFIIVTRNPRNHKLVIISDAAREDDPAEFETENEATSAALSIPVCEAWGFNVVDIP